MTDDFDPNQLFENMRNNLRQAPVAPATAVRSAGISDRSGHVS